MAVRPGGRSGSRGTSRGGGTRAPSGVSRGGGSFSVSARPAPPSRPAPPPPRPAPARLSPPSPQPPVARGFPLLGPEGGRGFNIRIGNALGGGPPAAAFGLPAAAASSLSSFLSTGQRPRPSANVGPTPDWNYISTSRGLGVQPSDRPYGHGIYVYPGNIDPAPYFPLFQREALGAFKGFGPVPQAGVLGIPSEVSSKFTGAGGSVFGPLGRGLATSQLGGSNTDVLFGEDPNSLFNQQRNLDRNFGLGTIKTRNEPFDIGGTGRLERPGTFFGKRPNAATEGLTAPFEIFTELNPLTQDELQFRNMGGTLIPETTSPDALSQLTEFPKGSVILGPDTRESSLRAGTEPGKVFHPFTRRFAFELERAQGPGAGLFGSFKPQMVQSQSGGTTPLQTPNILPQNSFINAKLKFPSSAADLLTEDFPDAKNPILNLLNRLFVGEGLQEALLGPTGIPLIDAFMSQLPMDKSQVRRDPEFLPEDFMEQFLELFKQQAKVPQNVDEILQDFLTNRGDTDQAPAGDQAELAQLLEDEEAQSGLFGSDFGQRLKPILERQFGGIPQAREQDILAQLAQQSGADIDDIIKQFKLFAPGSSEETNTELARLLSEARSSAETGRTSALQGERQALEQQFNQGRLTDIMSLFGNSTMGGRALRTLAGQPQNIIGQELGLSPDLGLELAKIFGINSI